MDSGGDQKWVTSITENETPLSVSESWRGKLQLRQGSYNTPGFRRPQIGAIYAALSHWSTSNSVATIVLPTGSGKTETMVSLLVKKQIKSLLVIVPTDALRTQISDKFLTLGLLPSLMEVMDTPKLPFVGILKKGIKTDAEAREFFSKCNVVVATMSAITACKPQVVDRIANHFEYLFIDEAHHSKATSWVSLQDRFRRKERRILQFTATPFREDGQKLEGRIIYRYPLRLAKEDGIFGRINFNRILEFDPEKHDEQIADAAIDALERDMKSGYSHVVLARVNSIKRAETVFEIYGRKFSKYSPQLIHSKMTAAERKSSLDKLLNLESKVIVCVDMLGEGFDFPSLKIAAMHDVHKSLTVTLQFIGRFVRNRSDLGEATIVANSADAKVDKSIERLYSENADWNELLGTISDERTLWEVKFEEFLEGFGEDSDEDIAIQNFQPQLSTHAFRTEGSRVCLDKLADGIKQSKVVAKGNNAEEKISYVIVADYSKVKWGDIKEIRNLTYNLYITFWDQPNEILFIYSSLKNGEVRKIARTICPECIQVKGLEVFSTLSRVHPLEVKNAGLKSYINRNRRFTMYMGADVTNGFDPADEINKIATNVFASGYRDGEKVTAGLSMKGKIWSQSTAKNLLEWKVWATKQGILIKERGFSVQDLFENMTRAEKINAIGEDENVLFIEWNKKIGKNGHYHKGRAWPLSDFDLRHIKITADRTTLLFSLVGVDEVIGLQCRITEEGVSYSQTNQQQFFIDEVPIVDYLTENPLSFYFASGSVLYEDQWQEITYPDSSFSKDLIEAWNWTDVNIKKESYWKNGKERRDSIQYKVMTSLEDDLIFDDDGAGEVADIVTFSKRDDSILVKLYHLKYSSKPAPGARVGDLYEVCGQAAKSIKYKTNLDLLFQRLFDRGRKRTTRYFKGNEIILKEFKYFQRKVPFEFEIYIVQPGLSKNKFSPSQAESLSSTRSYLRGTLDIPLFVISSE